MNSFRITLLALSVLAPLAAQATGQADVPQRSVSLSGWDLTQPEAAARVYRHLQTAAESVCQEWSTREPGRRSQLWRGCVANAIERAVKEVNAPALTAYYTEKTHRAGKSLSVASR